MPYPVLENYLERLSGAMQAGMRVCSVPRWPVCSFLTLRLATTGSR